MPPAVQKNNRSLSHSLPGPQKRGIPFGRLRAGFRLRSVQALGHPDLVVEYYGDLHHPPRRFNMILKMCHRKPVDTAEEPVRTSPIMKNNYLSWLRIVPIMVGLMSGALSIVREYLLFAFPEKYKEASLFWASVRIAFILSAATAWIIEHNLLNKERERNQKPDLHGEILEVLIGPCVPNSDPPMCASVVMLLVKAWNTVQMPEFTIYKYELAVSITSPTGPTTFTGIKEGWTVNMNFGGNFSVIHIAHELQPMRYIDAQKGFIPFYVNGLRPDTTEFTSIVLTLIDAIGGKHPIAFGNGRFTHGGILAQKIQIP